MVYISGYYNNEQRHFYVFFYTYITDKQMALLVKTKNRRLSTPKVLMVHRVRLLIYLFYSPNENTSIKIYKYYKEVKFESLQKVISGTNEPILIIYSLIEIYIIL